MTGSHRKSRFPRIKQFSSFLWADGANASTFIALSWTELCYRGFRFPFACGRDRGPCSSPREPCVFSVSEGRYICHSLCRDLLHLDCPQNGKRPRSSKRDSQVSRDVSGMGRILSFRPPVSPVLEEWPAAYQGVPEEQVCVLSLSLCLSYWARSSTPGYDFRTNVRLVPRISQQICHRAQGFNLLDHLYTQGLSYFCAARTWNLNLGCLFFLMYSLPFCCYKYVTRAT